MFKAVLFDADRTIFNNEGIHNIVTRKIVKELEMPLELSDEIHETWDKIYFREQARLMDEVGYCIDRENSARSLQIALKEFEKEISFEKADEFYNIMISEFSDLSKPYPDSLELIAFLKKKNIKMAIVSNGNIEVINNRLKKANIDHYFEFVLAPCTNFPLTKPDEKIFLESLKQVKTKAKETIFVGDNPYADIEGANQVGMFSVLIDRDNYFKKLEGLQLPNLKVANFNEMFHLFP